MNIFVILVVGSLIGWIANLFIYGHGLGIRGDIAAGILGAFLGLFIPLSEIFQFLFGSPSVFQSLALLVYF